MPSLPCVSVLLPVFNGAATLARAIGSVQEQTFPDWELLVVDDGSTDDTAALAIELAAADPRIRVLREPHRGIVGALHAGSAAARGEWIARHDADDECRPTRLEKQLALAARSPDCGVIATQVEFGGDPVAQAGYALHVAWTNSFVTPDEIATARFIDAPIAHPSVMFRRELVAQFGGYRDGDWPEDYELWLRWMDAGVRFAKVPEPLLVWHDPPQRLSRTHPRYRPEAFYACKCLYLARWLRREFPADRAIFLWGAGRHTRRRFDALREHGVTLAGYVDVDAKKIGGRADGLDVLAPSALPPAPRCLVIVGVSTRGARELIRAQLTARGFVEGRDWIAAA